MAEISIFFNKLLNLAAIVASVLFVKHVDDGLHGKSSNTMHDLEYGISLTDYRVETMHLQTVAQCFPLVWRLRKWFMAGGSGRFP